MPPSPSTAEPSLASRILRRAVDLVAVGAVFVLLLTVCGFLARLSWRLELLCHGRVQYFWSLALATAILLAARSWRMSAAAAAGALVNLAVIAPIYWPAAKPPASAASPLHLVSFNVLSSNTRYADVLAHLRRENADVVLLLEVSPQFAEQLKSLRDLYPHQHVEPKSHDFGIALLSKRPWKSVRTVESPEVAIPCVVAQFDRGGRPLTVVGLHPPPPLSAWMFQERNAQLAAAALLAREQAGSVIIAGDLNVTSYSPYFGDLLRTADLRDTRQGFGLQTSWSPGLWLLSATIDHCLVSPDLAIRRHRIGPGLGSDHRAVSVVVQ